MWTTLSAFLLVLGCVVTTPIKKETLSLSFAPAEAKVITEETTQMFRAPLCKGMFVDNWAFSLKVYLQNVQWDSREIGDANWLRIRISNKADMSNILCDNAKAGIADPVNFCPIFTYKKKEMGEGDLYIEITASAGTPTYQYGLDLEAREQKHGKFAPNAIPEAAAAVKALTIETLEQVAVPYLSDLVTGQTGQYKIPYCFEGAAVYRKVTTTTLVPDSDDAGAGGVASFFCTNAMMHNDECYRSVSKRKGSSFYDPSGAKINTVSPKVKLEEYGPVYILVLAQGDWQKEIKFTITAKLKNPGDPEIKGKEEL